MKPKVSKASKEGKVTVRVRPEQIAQLDEWLDWGQRDELFRRLMDSLLEALESEGKPLVNRITRGKARIVIEG